MSETVATPKMIRVNLSDAEYRKLRKLALDRNLSAAQMIGDELRATLRGERPQLDRIERIETVVRQLAWWLVEAQTDFGRLDAEAIDRLLDGRQ